MGQMTIDRAEKYRLSGFDCPGFSTKSKDPFGMFQVKGLRIMVAPIDLDWEHVSVSRKHRVPNWGEMCFVKDLFWDDSETVVQFHPKASNYVNLNEFCLHLWGRKDLIYELPPMWMV